MIIFKDRLLASPVNIGFCMAFKHCFSFVNFECNQFRIIPDIVSKLVSTAIWSCCAVWFKSEQPPLSQTDNQFKSVALHNAQDWIQNMICSDALFSFRDQSMNDWKIEQSNEYCFGWSHNLESSIKNFTSFHMKNKASSHCLKFTKHWIFLTLELKFHFTWKTKGAVTAWNIHSIESFWLLNKSGSPFPSSEPVAARRDCSRLGNSLCLCLPIHPAQVVPECSPKSSALILLSKNLIVFWNSLWEWLPDDQQGLKLGPLVKLKLCCLTHGLNRFYLPQNPRKICVEFEFFFSLLKTQKLRTAVSWYQHFDPRLLYSEAFPLLLQYWQPKTRMRRIHCIFLSLSDKKTWQISARRQAFHIQNSLFKELHSVPLQVTCNSTWVLKSDWVRTLKEETQIANINLRCFSSLGANKTAQELICTLTGKTTGIYFTISALYMNSVLSVQDCNFEFSKYPKFNFLETERCQF